MSLELIIILVVLLVLFGGGGYWGYRSGWYGTPTTAGPGFNPVGLIMMILVIVLVIWLVLYLLNHMPR